MVTHRSKINNTRGNFLAQITLTRSLLAVFAAATVWFFVSDWRPAAVIIVLYGIFIGVSALWLMRLPNSWAKSSLNLICEYALIISLIIISGGVKSPYLLFLLFLAVLGSALYGAKGLIAGFVLSLVPVGFLVFSSGALPSLFELLALIVCMLLAGFIAAEVAGGHSMSAKPPSLPPPLEPVVSREQAKLSVLINSLSEAVFIVDRVGKIVLYNGAALELLDTHADILNRPFDKLLSLQGPKRQPVDVVALAIAQAKLVIRDDLVYHAGKHIVDVHVTANPIINNGQAEGILVLMRDISQQKTLQDQKDEFISIISHELRTPVAVVEADLSTLLVPGFAQLPDRVLKLVRSAQGSLVFLQGLLQDLSELSQADRSVLNIEVNQIEPVAIINEVIKDLNPKAQAAEIEVKTEVADDLPAIFSSRERLKEILVNLLTNAIKYSGDGKTVVVTAHPSIKMQGGVQFSVSDRGIGMSQADQKQLFAKFFRAENEATQRIKGTGMGLYISKKQADRIGAKIWLESKLNVGSTFYLEVPAKIPSEQKEI